MNAMTDKGASQVGTTVYAVWMVMWRHADRDGVVSVSQKRIARTLGVHVGTVKRAQRQLRQKGWLNTLRPGSKGRRAVHEVTRPPT